MEKCCECSIIYIYIYIHHLKLNMEPHLIHMMLGSKILGTNVLELQFVLCWPFKTQIFIQFVLCWHKPNTQFGTPLTQFA